MRGKAVRPACIRRLIGITPAYAGKRAHKVQPVCYGRDHPRLCGEKTLRVLAMKVRRGSPPPMRGKAVRLPSFSCCCGITPAYAGKSQMHCLRSNLSQGSPPPMRGKGSRCAVSFRSLRITPAYAGKRRPFDCRFSEGWDHPRLCGEKKGSLIVIDFNTGSPPPMRGKDLLHVIVTR